MSGQTKAIRRYGLIGLTTEFYRQTEESLFEFANSCPNPDAQLTFTRWTLATHIS
jgi:hypothetical protein